MLTMKKILLLLIVISSYQLSAQDKKAYQIFDQTGKKVSYEKMTKKLVKDEIILFGEYHDNPIIHWLQYELTVDLQKKNKLILGFEMLEADNQTQINAYLSGEINQKKLDTVARLWNNYKTDYKPLVDFAKSKNIAVVATNIPRRYASMVYKNDFQILNDLKDEEKNWIAPLPIKYDPNLPGYKNMLTMMGDHPNEKLPKAQAIKDATMAYFILKNYQPNVQLIHYNGFYHSDNFEGIYWYLKQEQPHLKIGTIATVSQDDLETLSKDHVGKADFIIVVHSNMTKTF